MTRIAALLNNRRETSGAQCVFVLPEALLFKGAVSIRLT